jgi:tetratricopeptide (TPR) repeat protein
MCAGRIVLSLLLLVFAWSLPAHAQEKAQCLAVPQKPYIDACTAIIENPYREPLERADAYANRGLSAAIIGEYAKSIEDFDKALEIIPDHANVLNNKAWSIFKWKRSDAGMADVERALELEPNLGYFWDTRAHLRQLQNNFEGAFQDYEMAVKLGGVETIKIYQCGLIKQGLYKGDIDGFYSSAVRAAMKACAYDRDCDPLPDNADFIVEQKPCEDIIS